MAEQSALGGSRDIMALRSSNTQLAAVIDAMVEFATTQAASWAGYAAEDFVAMGTPPGGTESEISADDAYWMALTYQEMPAKLDDAVIQWFVSVADKLRDVSR